MTISEFKPEFVIPLEFEGFNRKVELLSTAGFKTSVRQGSTNLLLFVKLGNKTYEKLHQFHLGRDYELGIESTDDDRTRIVGDYLQNIFKDEVDDKLLAKVTESGQKYGVKDSWKIAGEGVGSEAKTKAEIAKSDNIPDFFAVTAPIDPETSLYFKFFNYYLVSLSILSVIGILFYFYKPLSLTYTFINLLWGLIFITGWKLPEQKFINSWGLQNVSNIEKVPQTVSGKKRSYRFLKQLAFIPIALFFTLILVSFQLSCFVAEIFITEIYVGPLRGLLKFLPTILIVVFIPILTIFYDKVVNKVIKWENHETASSKRNSVLLKQFVLHFLTSYIPLLITSFIYLPFAHLIQPSTIRSYIDVKSNNSAFYYKYISQLKRTEDFKINQTRLNTQFFYYVVTNQVIQLIVKYVIPFIRIHGELVYQKFSGKALETPSFNDDESEVEFLKKIRKTEKLPKFDVTIGYKSLIIQYGYLIIFGSVWPLAPVASLVFNLITISADRKKLSSGRFYKPSIPNRIDSIHPWNIALFLLTWVGSFVGPLITIFYRHGTTPPKPTGHFGLNKASVNGLSRANLIFILFIAEHGFLVLFYTLNKLYDLLRSDSDWSKDFVEDDVKLRREYFSSNIKKTVKSEESANEEEYTVEATIVHAEKLKTLYNKQKEIEEKKKELAKLKKKGGHKLTEGSQNSSAFTTSSTQGDSSGLTSRFNKSTEREGLEAIKDDQDEIISTNINGKQVLSTIDNHGHINDSSAASIASSNPASKVSASAYISDKAKLDIDPRQLTTGKIGDNKTAGGNTPSSKVVSANETTTRESGRKNVPGPKQVAEPAPKTAEPSTSTARDDIHEESSNNSDDKVSKKKTIKKFLKKL